MGADIYRRVADGRLKSWIYSGKIKYGEVVVWRSGFSGWRKPEELEELIPCFRRYERVKLRRVKIGKPAERVLSSGIDLPNSTGGRVLPGKNRIKNILIIDDEEDLCRLLEETLSSYGYNVKFAHNNKNALSSLKEQIPDLVFCDLRLSDGDGMKIFSKIKSISPGTIVTIITAYGSGKARDEAKRLGADSFIDKPFSEEDILENIKELSNPKGQAQRKGLMREHNEKNSYCR